MSEPLRAPAGRRDVRLLPVTTSSNDQARDWACAGAPDGACVVTDAQTAGRGRLGRTWHSPPGCNLYLSRVTRTRAQRAGLVPLLGAVATREAISRSLSGTTRVRIKWPNDLIADGRKLAGVLAEVVDCPEDGPLTLVLLGIGINVNAGPADLPTNPRWPAGSLSALTGHPIDRNALLSDLLASLDRWKQVLDEQADRLVTEMRQHCATLGRPVRVHPPGAEPFEGIARDIGPTGVLRVEQASGRLVEILAGDVDLLSPIGV